MVFAQPTSIGGYNVYYGILHNHSNFSDGQGTALKAYTYARDSASLDFFGLSDHSSHPNFTSETWSATKSVADSINQDGVFSTFTGFEWTSSIYGHVAVINTSDYISTTNSSYDSFDELYGWLSLVNNGIAFFNHPGIYNSVAKEFDHFTDTPSDIFVGMELWNKNLGFATYFYNDGYFAGDTKGYFDEANSLKWKIGASGSDDNHTANWGNRNGYRLAVLANALNRGELLLAMQVRRFYSTEDKNIVLSFKINGNEMGASITEGTYTAQIQAEDGDLETFSKVELRKNGNVIQTWFPNLPSLNLTTELTTLTGEYYYIKVTQTDGNEAISSPIYIESTNGCSDYMVVENSFMSGTYNLLAKNRIVASNQISNGATVQYGANSVHLMSGFRAYEGSSFSVSTTGCSETKSAKFIDKNQENRSQENTMATFVQLFPNPSKGGFFIQLAEDLTITRIIINDISGKTVYNKTHNSNLVSLNLTNQKRGIYIVTVISNNSSTVKKLIIE